MIVHVNKAVVIAQPTLKFRIEWTIIISWMEICKNHYKYILRVI